MKTNKCFTCDLSLNCEDCEYAIYNDGYAYTKRTHFKRANEAWNYYYPRDLMPQEGYVVHHDYKYFKDINSKEDRYKNKLDDSKENLKKWIDRDHCQYHGKNRPEETKEKQRQFMKGKQIARGCKHSEKWKAKKGEAAKGNQYALGYKHTEEANARKSERMKGKQYTLGYKHTKEQNARKSETTKKYWEEVKSGRRKRP